MKKTPEKETKKKRFSRGSLMENNKFIFLISLIIAFFIWAAVAMYKSPEESFTIYNVPITVDTENSIIAQKGYKNFWQSDEKIDVTVTGPRYMVTALKEEDINVSAVLNTVDSAGIAELPLRVTLKDDSRDITVSALSKTSIEVYFDAELTKELSIKTDSAAISHHVAEGYIFENAALTVSTVEIIGPEMEINKIVNVVAAPKFPEESMFKTASIPVSLNFEGETVEDTVSVNKYVHPVDEQEYFINIEISRVMELKPSVEFTGTPIDGVAASFSADTVNVKFDTSKEDYTSDELPILTVDYGSLSEGVNSFTVDMSKIKLPDGITITDGNVSSIKVDITVPEQ